MIPHVTEARYVSGYTIYIVFSDGTQGEIDLSNELEGEIFEPLKDVDRFKKFTVPPDVGTVTWANGADLAPEFLYDKVKIQA